MSFGWEAVAARARGMSTHLLDDETLDRLAVVDGPASLFGILERASYGDGFQRTGGDPTTVEAAVTRVLTRRLELLTRWMRPHEELLAPVLLPLDAATLRGILRGMAAGLPPDERTADAIPTATLDRRAIGLLAASPSPGSVAATLVAWGHPLAPGLLQAASGEGSAPALFRMEAALGRATAEQMSAATRKGDPPLRRYTEEEIDAWNASTALALTATRPETDPGALFLPGGQVFDEKTFVRAAGADSRHEARTVLLAAAGGSVFARALAASDPAPWALEDAVLRSRVERRRRETLERPLSSAPALEFVLRSRRESLIVRRAAWRASLPSRRAS